MSGAGCQRSYDRGMGVRRVAVTLAVIGSIAVPAEATAAKIYAPPGKAGTSQYAETLPASGGNVGTPATTGGNPTGVQLSKLGAGAAGARKLAKLGKTGQSAAAFASATAPTLTRARHLLAPAANVSSGTQIDRSGGSAASGVLHLIGGSDSGGIGVFLPLLLAFSLGAAVAVGARRGLRRRQRPV
jgi:hypothetical protein